MPMTFSAVPPPTHASSIPSIGGAQFLLANNTFVTGAETQGILGVTPPAAPAITSVLTATATVSVAFTYQITASNTPTSFSATGLPAGLSINTATGLITGTPTTVATTNITIGATNAGGTGNATLVLTVVASSIIYDFTSASLPSGVTSAGATNGTLVNSSILIVAGTAPRFDYGGVTGPALLVEPAATNISCDLTPLPHRRGRCRQPST